MTSGAPVCRCEELQRRSNLKIINHQFVGVSMRLAQVVIALVMALLLTGLFTLAFLRRRPWTCVLAFFVVSCRWLRGWQEIDGLQ